MPVVQSLLEVKNIYGGLSSPSVLPSHSYADVLTRFIRSVYNTYNNIDNNI